MDSVLNNETGAGLGARQPPNWKPKLFNPLFLLFLATLHLLHIVGIQVLVNRRGTDQAKLDPILQNKTIISSPGTIFAFEEHDAVAFTSWVYLPVAIVVIVAAFWEPLDLTVRRLEPFRQLSGWHC
jgi:uncharacterized membrane protein YhaH (DUF805 family)